LPGSSRKLRFSVRLVGAEVAAVTADGDDEPQAARPSPERTAAAAMAARRVPAGLCQQESRVRIR
jgi:hypothetical protein